MLTILDRVVSAMPQLLQEDAAWKSVDVDYHPPRVERLWRDFGEYRVCLHRIHPCLPADALFHPHPWPSAMLILAGSYEMGTGYSLTEVVPEITQRRVVSAGERYSMVDPGEWHYVAPFTPVFSLMVTGEPWERPTPRPAMPLQPVGETERGEILAFGKQYFPV